MPRPDPRSLLAAPLRGFKALADAIFSSPNQWGWGAASSNGGAVIARKVGDGGENSIVVPTIGWLQRNFIQAPLRVRVPGDDGVTLTPATSAGANRMLEVLEDPNPVYDWATLAKASILSERLTGEFFWMVVRNRMGAPTQYWWIPHSLIEPKRDEGSSEFITHYSYTPQGVPIRLGLDDVVHHRDGIDPVNPLRGMSKLKAALREVYTDEEAAAFTATLLVNMGVPGIVISPTEGNAATMGITGPDDLALSKAKFEQITTGGNRGRTVFMGGPTNIQTIGFSPEQMNLRELRRIPEERVTAAIGVPAVVVGLGAGLDRSTFANMQEAREAAVEEALVPLWNDVARTIKKRVLPEFEGTRAAGMTVDFDLTNVRVLREDQDKVVDRAIRLQNAGASKVSETREAAGLPVDEEHEIYLRPLTLIEVPAGVVEDDTPADRTLEYRMTALVNAGMITPNMALERLGFPPQPGGDVLRTVEAPTGDAPAKGLKAAPKRVPRESQARVIQKLARDARQLEAAFAKRLEKSFKALGAHVIESYRKAGGVGEKALDADDAAIVAATMRYANIAKWRKQNFDNAYSAHYQGVVAQSVETVNATLGISIGSVDDIAVQVIKEGGTRVGLVDIAKQTEDAIKATIADARAAGLGPADIERKIRAAVEGGGPTANVSSRAMRIARTETLHAQRVSTRLSYAESFTTLIAWDDRLGHGDDECGARNGQEFSFEDAEAEENDTHPNCTLSWAPGTVRE